MLTVPAAQAAVDPAGPVAAAFGARELQQMSMSPDGARIAILIPTRGRGAALRIFDMASGKIGDAILMSSGDPESLRDCHWSTNTRLICRISTTAQSGAGLLGFSRALAVDSDGGNMKMLSARTNDRSLDIMQDGGAVIDWTADGVNGAVLMTRKFVPESTIGTHLASSADGLGVERIDTLTLSRRTVEPARNSAAEYISDGRGTVRIMGTREKSSSGYDRGKIVYSYRKPDDRNWLPLSQVVAQPSGGSIGFDPYAVDHGLNVVYGFDDADGRQALYSITLDGSLKRNLVLTRPDVDVDTLIRIGRQNRVVGASYATDRREVAFFDPALKTLAASLHRALPGQPIITFVDASADETKLLLFAGSDVDPGRYYLLDRTTKKMGEVLPARQELAKATLAPVKAITFQAADGTMIPGYLTLPAGRDGKGLPAIVMPHGLPGARDEWGFDWLSQYFAARGFAVLQPNFRGSTGYGSAWFQKNGFQSWRTAIADVDDAGRWLVSQGIAAPDKLAIVGWSYGGYAALQSAVLDPGLFKAIVAIAPVTDLEALRSEARNFSNYTMVDAFIGHGPHIQAGSPARHADKIKVPVLLFHGDQDRNVGIGESRLMASKLKGAGGEVELVEFTGLDHQLDDDVARTAMLTKADAFLRASLGM
ncbi:alpha/beta hydrolase family protein [Sphingomonas faeni]|uniref:alpha/beta hydrolase family protein n=1 Tax=Sphingomonas faeni TaxID=185950 RepID=UPI0020BF309D|nr:S9 family peptidase [Sphingomonas faeni]MCK8457665.1 S9 family peptidase [Sphingomonas faeni]